MEDFKLAITLGLAAQQNIAITSDDPEAVVATCKSLCSKTSPRPVVVDLALCQTYADLLDRVVERSEGQMPKLYDLMILKNIEATTTNRELRAMFDRFTNELRRSDTVASKSASPQDPMQMGPYTVRKPINFLMVALLGDFPRAQLTRIIKDKFWFKHSMITAGSAPIEPIELETILAVRARIAQVYMSPEVEEYICSLLVFTRTHRLCSLAPLTTRPSLSALNGISLLAKALIAVQTPPPGQKLFVTPDYVKVAYRKVGYWLVDWESNAVFSDPNPDLEDRRRLEISSLSGDWYGSEYESVKEYLARSRTVYDPDAPEGYTNRIVEDTLKSVQPPM